MSAVRKGALDRVFTCTLNQHTRESRAMEVTEEKPHHEDKLINNGGMNRKKGIECTKANQGIQ